MDIARALEKELEQAKRQVVALGKALAAFQSTLLKNERAGGRPTKKKRHMSAAARRKISLAQKARWAKHKSKAKA